MDCCWYIVRFVLNLEIILVMQCKVLIRQSILNRVIKPFNLELDIVVQIVFTHDMLHCCAGEKLSGFEEQPVT
jgi:hypothetical protein